MSALVIVILLDWIRILEVEGIFDQDSSGR